MMEGIRQYLIRVTAMALICGIATTLCGKKGTGASVVKILTTVCMLLTIVSPLADIRISSLADWSEQIGSDAEQYVADGENTAREEMVGIIKAQVEAYILDKAASLGADVSVDVGFSAAGLPTPDSVRISGAVSPYGKKRLQQIILEELGIPVEEQIWIG